MATGGHEGGDDESVGPESVGRHGEAFHVDLFAMTLDMPHAETATAAPIRPRPLMASSVLTSVPGIAARYRRHPLLHLVLGEEALVDLDQDLFLVVGQVVLGPDGSDQVGLGFLVEDAGADVKRFRRDLKRSRDLLQDLRARPLQTPFDLAEVRIRDASEVGELPNGEFGLAALLTNVFTEVGDGVSRIGRHEDSNSRGGMADERRSRTAMMAVRLRRGGPRARRMGRCEVSGLLRCLLGGLRSSGLRCVDAEEAPRSLAAGIDGVGDLLRQTLDNLGGEGLGAATKP